MRALGPLVRPTLIAFGAALLLIVAYDLVERSILVGSDPELLHGLHRLRGAAAALIAGSLASWLILRRAPPMLASAPGEDPVGAAGPDPHDRRLHYARWFVWMRWIAIIIVAILVFSAVVAFELLPREVGLPLAVSLAFLALANGAYALHLRKGHASQRFLVVQVYIDVAVLLALIHLSGGIENPLTPLTLLHVILAAVVIDRRSAYRVAVTISLLFALVAWGEWSGILPHYTLTLFPHPHDGQAIIHAAQDSVYVVSRVMLQAATLLLVAFFTTSLTDRIREDERRLEWLVDRSQAQAQLLERALDTTRTAARVHDRQTDTVWTNERWDSWLDGMPGVEVDAAAASESDGREVRVREITAPVALSNGRAAERARETTYQLVTAPVLDRDGKVRHVVTLARDISDQKAIQAVRIRAERLAALGNLAGQVAHEINNPVAILSSKARLLLAASPADLPTKAAVEIPKIIDLADRIGRIAQGLVFFCRPSPAAPVTLDLRDPVRRVLEDLDALAREAGVRIVSRMPDDLPLVAGNLEELEQVFLNLALNALDAMPDGGELRVSASSAPANSSPGVEVVIEDNGVGIPLDVGDRIFEPFLTTKPPGRGSGLGLSVCLGLIQSHGGQITVESEPGRFTRFRVRLPAAPSPHEVVRPESLELGTHA